MKAAVQTVEVCCQRHHRCCDSLSNTALFWLCRLPKAWLGCAVLKHWCQSHSDCPSLQWPWQFTISEHFVILQCLGGLTTTLLVLFSISDNSVYRVHPLSPNMTGSDCLSYETTLYLGHPTFLSLTIQHLWSHCLGSSTTKTDWPEQVSISGHCVLGAQPPPILRTNYLTPPTTVVRKSNHCCQISLVLTV